MVLEIAKIEIKDGYAEHFENAVREAAPIFRRAKGCRAVTLERSLDEPLSYRLLVQWDTLENHVVDFQQSTDFQEWRKLVGHCFAAVPEVEHTTRAIALELNASRASL